MGSTDWWGGTRKGDNVPGNQGGLLIKGDIPTQSWNHKN